MPQPSFRRLRVLAGAIVLLIASLTPGRAAPDEPRHQIVEGRTRFTVLAPDLIRMETSPAGAFIDEPSVVALKRDWPATAAARVERKDAWLVLTTDKMTLHYKLDAGAFTAQTLAITWHDAQGEHAWKPGDADGENLGGVVGDIAIRSKPVDNPGLLSRKGCFLARRQPHPAARRGDALDQAPAGQRRPGLVFLRL